jgi:putative nucleotidyltransferase with HDIG domain
MSVIEPASPRPALPDRPRRFRWRYYLARTLMVVILLAVAAALVPGGRMQDRLRYREGDIARERIVAPYDLPVHKDEATLRREQEQAAASVPPVFVVDARVSADNLARFATFQERALAAVGGGSESPEPRFRDLKAIGASLSDEHLRALTSPGRARRTLRDVDGWLRELLVKGVVAEKRNGLLLGYRSVTVREGESETLRDAGALADRREAAAWVEQRARSAYAEDPRGVSLAAGLAAAFLEPNVVHDRAETEWRRVQARGAVPVTLATVKKDELIVDANQRVDRATLGKLLSLREHEAARRSRTEFLYPPVARMLLMLLFIAVFATYLRVELPQVYADNALLGVFTLLTSLVLMLAALIVGVFALPEFAVPLAVAPLVVGSLLDKRPALVYTLLLAVVVLAVVEMRAPFIPVAVMGGMTAVYSVTRLRHRWHFMRAALVIGMANLAAILAWDLARETSWRALLFDAGAGMANAVAATALAFMMLPVVEHLFRQVSDVTLLELSDLNRSLLKRMQLEAPGTYHHSMVVGNLAEAAAESIGANSLLARVCAYYHDVGKISKAQYYGENQVGSRSLHDKLTPTMSALVLRAHINEGLEIARKEHLPRAVRAAIPEHHGTMVMAYFYHKALEGDPAARREEYSYPGPKPRSRETAILMLADGVEGASRALQQPTSSRIKGLVTRIIEQRVQDGQLDDCPLTLQDLARIRDAFIPVLTATFHVRAPYPTSEPRRRTDADIHRESAS